MKKRFIIGIIGILIIGSSVFILSHRNVKRLSSKVKTEVVTQGDIKAYLSTTATIKSKNSKDYYGISAKTLQVNVKVGDKVTKGQVLVQYDVQDLTTNVKTAETQYNNAQITYDNAQIAYNNAVSQKNDAINTNNQNETKLQDQNIDGQINDYTNRLNTLNDKITSLENEINNQSTSPSTVNNDKIQLNGAQQGSPTTPNIIPGQGSLYSQRDSILSQLNSLKNTKLQLQPASDEKTNQLNNAISTASNNLQTAKNNIDSAKANLDAAKANLAKSTDKIAADFDGIVTSVNAVQGAMGNAAQVAISVQDLNNLEADLTVGKYDAANIKIGEAAIIKDNGKTYNGQVSSIDPTAKQPGGISASNATNTSTDATLGVTVDITDKPDGLKVNFSDDIDILLGQVTGVVKVPVESIETDKTGKNTVFIVENHRAIEKEVTLGLQSDTEAEIKEGIKAGDTIILNPSATIKTGTFVK